jgi:uncharacterized protein YdhG (YjbR/CyaY superfamily)
MIGWKLNPVKELRMKTGTTPKDVTAYIARFPPGVQRVLKRVRRIVRKGVPGAEESISYQIPTYKLHEGIARFRAKEVAAAQKAKA